MMTGNVRMDSRARSRWQISRPDTPGSVLGEAPGIVISRRRAAAALVMRLISASAN